MSHSATATAWRGRERALRTRGIEVELYAARRWHAGGADVALTEHEEAHTHPVTTWGHHPALFLYDPRPLWRALGEPWSVVDIHEEPFALATAEILLLRALRRNRSPVVLYSAQNLRKRYPIPFRWLERWALHTASGISTCNFEAARIVEDKGFAGAARVIPLGHDPDEFAPAAASDPSTGSPAHTVVGFVGRLVPEKGVRLLLDAVASQPTLHARIAGGGPLADELATEVRRRGLGDRVELLGPIDPSEVSEFYRSLHVLAVPSVPTAQWTEQFGRVAVEAMASGIPVVASTAGALPDVVGDAGILVPPADAQALAQSILVAARDAAAIRVRGLARAAESTWEAVADHYVDLYDTVARRTTAERAGMEIVVVAYGRPDLLRSAIAPLAHLPITVVDNSSQAAVAALCDDLGVRYIDPGRNGGFAAGVNIALRDRLVPDADVLLLNPDASVDAATVERLQEFLAASPDLASVAPAQTDAAGRPSRVAWPFPTPVGSWLDALGLGRLRRGPQFMIGAILLLRAEAIAHVGLFDERFFLYSEETDWAYRAHRLGWRHALAPTLRAVHVGAATSTDSRVRTIRFHAAQERYHRKHYGASGWAATRAAVALGALARGVLSTGWRRDEAFQRAALYLRGPVRLAANLSSNALRDGETGPV
ncbi:glycosyltransferase [Microbacterium marinum]|uniref:glycosyltransferase n=1 Tax=Microbacterium marinum TaxID=421115 RepID=UPI003850AC30